MLAARLGKYTGDSRCRPWGARAVCDRTRPKTLRVYALERSEIDIAGGSDQLRVNDQGGVWWHQVEGSEQRRYPPMCW